MTCIIPPIPQFLLEPVYQAAGIMVNKGVFNTSKEKVIKEGRIGAPRDQDHATRRIVSANI